jgi:phenylacetate-CoA ligase
MIVSSYGLSYRSLKQGRLFKRILSELEKSQWYSEAELMQLQNEKLKKLVRFAYENVPYYRGLFQSLHLKPEDIKEASDLNKLPILTKDEVRRNLDKFVAKNISKSLSRHFFKRFTSGTTGSPLMLYRDIYSLNFEEAIITRQYHWAGFDLSQRKVVLRSEPVALPLVNRPPFGRYNLPQYTLLLSSYHLSKKNISLYAKEISDFRPSALDAVPSTAYLFAKLLKDRDINGINFKYVFTSSETLTFQRAAFIKEQFKSRIFDHYGVAERVVAIGTCEKGNYHVYPEYGITEFIPVNGDPKKREIIGTGLNNFIMPLFRYRTKDIAILSADSCPCNRKFPLVERLEGRMFDEYLTTRDGRILPLVCNLVSIDTLNIIEAQVLQLSDSHILVKIVPEKTYSTKDEINLKKNIMNFLGQKMKLSIEKVSYIPRDRSGKFRPFISRRDQ